MVSTAPAGVITDNTEGVVEARVLDKGIDKIAMGSGIDITDGYLEFFPGFQQVIAVVVPHLGNGPIEVINFLVLVNVVDDYLVSDYRWQTPAVPPLGGVKSIGFAAKHVGYGEGYLADTRIIGRWRRLRWPWR